MPDVEFKNELTSGGSVGIKGHTGSGKGPLNPEEDARKNPEHRN